VTLFVRFDESIHLNPVTGEIKTSAGGSIPLSTPIVVMKHKPALKHVGNAGGVWFGANKMSFALLLAYVMLKNNKGRVIGFYKYKDRYLYIEGAMDMYHRLSIQTGITAEGETPEMFITLSGKVYDAIFGTEGIKNIDFNFIGAYRALSKKVKPIHIAALAASAVIIVFLVHAVFFKPPPVIEVPRIVQKAPPPPPPLSAEESFKLMAAAKNIFISKFADAQDEVAGSRGEKWLKRVVAKTEQNPDGQSILVDVTFTYNSYYPFTGSKKEGKEYVYTRSYNERLTRQDIGRYQISDTGLETCLKYLINYDVVERSPQWWLISLKEEKYPRVVFLLRVLSRCPCVIKDMSIDGSGGMSGTVSCQSLPPTGGPSMDSQKNDLKV